MRMTTIPARCRAPQWYRVSGPGRFRGVRTSLPRDRYDASRPQTVVANLLAGQYEHPVRVVAFNTAEGWAHDVTAEIAREALLRADHELAPAVRDFLERAP